MELKLTADKKLLEALDRLASAMTAVIEKAPQTAPEAPQIAVVAQCDEMATPEVEPEQPVLDGANPAPDTSQPTEPAPTRDEVRALATVKIQAGHRDAVKALIAQCDGTRVSDVPEDRLAEFRAGLEAIA